MCDAHDAAECRVAFLFRRDYHIADTIFDFCIGTDEQAYYAGTEVFGSNNVAFGYKVADNAFAEVEQRSVLFITVVADSYFVSPTVKPAVKVVPAYTYGGACLCVF